MGFKSIQPVYTTLPGWNSSTAGITDYDNAKAAQDYLTFIAKESGAAIGMISPPVSTAPRP